MPEANFTIGDWTVRPTHRVLERQNERVVLEPKLIDVLTYLAGRSGDIVSVDDLLDHCWAGRFYGDNPVHKCIALLRKALGDDAREPRYVATVRKRGYRIIAPVHRGRVVATPSGATGSGGAVGGAAVADAAGGCAAAKQPRLHVTVGAFGAFLAVAGCVLVAWDAVRAERKAEALRIDTAGLLAFVVGEGVAAPPDTPLSDDMGRRAAWALAVDFQEETPMGWMRVAHAMDAMGSAALRAGRPDLAAARFDMAVALERRVIGANPHDNGAWFALRNSLRMASDAYRREGSLRESELYADAAHRTVILVRGGR